MRAILEQLQHNTVYGDVHEGYLGAVTTQRSVQWNVHEGYLGAVTYNVAQCTVDE